MLRKIYFSLSPTMRRLARRWVYAPIDFWYWIIGNKHPLAPPRGLIFTGSGDFIQSGIQLKTICITEAGLMPTHKVLDVGCGIGRLAVALTPFIEHPGSYHGFDVVKDGISWCKKNISKKFPLFHFLHTPLRNDLYNLATQAKAEEFNFPYSSSQFNLVVLTSVFTHMQYAEVAHYLSEINRVLVPGGKCLCTFFIIDDETKAAISNNEKMMSFEFEYEHYYLHNQTVKDANIAFKKQALFNLFSLNNFKINSFNKGWWRNPNQPDALNFQDLIVIEKLA